MSNARLYVLNLIFLFCVRFIELFEQLPKGSHWNHFQQCGLVLHIFDSEVGIVNVTAKVLTESKLVFLNEAYDCMILRIGRLSFLSNNDICRFSFR